MEKHTKYPLSFYKLEQSVLSCQHCVAHLPLPPKPILQMSPKAKLLVVGQAPGIRAHNAGRPFDDPSGDRLRDWLGVSKDTFYNPDLIALVPMGFCYPGTGKSGDLPPRPECAEKWRKDILSQLTDIKLTLVLGAYAQEYHIGGRKQSVTKHVENWQRLLAENKLALPHPSPRNNRWLKEHPWFEADVLPVLRLRVFSLLS